MPTEATEAIGQGPGQGAHGLAGEGDTAPCDLSSGVAQAGEITGAAGLTLVAGGSLRSAKG